MSADATRVVSAPGKLVLAGEYAVVDGHRALACAVDVRALVRASPAPALVVEGNNSGPIDARDQSALRARLPLVAAVLDELENRRGPRAPPALALHIDTSAFSRDGAKVGLGSSAAVASALVRTLAPDLSVLEVCSLARAAHRRFQGGGSGIDVAASCLGGVIAMEGDVVTEAPPLPSELAWIIVYVGSSTSTQGFVDRYRALADRAHHAARLTAAADAFCDACAKHDAPAVLAAIDDARDAMARMGEAAGIDVVSAPHARVAELARAHGGAAKPSGAGGGDVALSAVPARRREPFVAALVHAGFTVIDAALGVAGVG